MNGLFCSKSLACIFTPCHHNMSHFQDVNKDAFFKKIWTPSRDCEGRSFKPSDARSSSLLGSRLPLFFFWEHRPMSHYGGIWDVEMNFQMICTRCIFL